MAPQPVRRTEFPDISLSDARSPVERLFRSPKATRMVQGLGFVADEQLIEAACYNRRVARRRMVEAGWPPIPSFSDVVEMPEGTDYAGSPVASVHGDADFGRQGAQRQAYEVLAYCNELLRYKPPLHPYHGRLYAWALEFPVGGIDTFVVAANNFGRLRRVWPSAVFLPRSLADHLDVPFAQEGGLEEYLEQLASSAALPVGWDHGLVSFPSLPALPRPFRPPSCHLRLMADSAVLERRAYLAPAWASGLTRAPAQFNLGRWLPKTPAWWVDSLPVIETPFAVPYVASALLSDTNAAWSYVYDELNSFALAAWIHALRHDGIFARLSTEQLEAFDSLGTTGLEEGEDGQVRRDTYHKMCQAHNVFPWGYITEGVRRHDATTQEARQVYVKLDDTSQYGFVLRHPCRGFNWKPDPGFVPPPDSAGPSGRDFPLVRRRGGEASSGWRSQRRPRSPSPAQRVVAHRAGVVLGASSQAKRFVRTVAVEPAWSSTWTRDRMVGLFGEARVAHLDDRLVPTGAVAGAMAVAWANQLDGLKAVLRSAHGKPTSEAIPLFVRGIASAGQVAALFHAFVRELALAPEAPRQTETPARINVRAILAADPVPEMVGDLRLIARDANIAHTTMKLLELHRVLHHLDRYGLLPTPAVVILVDDRCVAPTMTNGLSRSSGLLASGLFTSPTGGVTTRNDLASTPTTHVVSVVVGWWSNRFPWATITAAGADQAVLYAVLPLPQGVRERTAVAAHAAAPSEAAKQPVAAALALTDEAMAMQAVRRSLAAGAGIGALPAVSPLSLRVVYLSRWFNYRRRFNTAPKSPLIDTLTAVAAASGGVMTVVPTLTGAHLAAQVAAVMSADVVVGVQGAVVTTAVVDTWGPDLVNDDSDGHSGGGDGNNGGSSSDGSSGYGNGGDDGVCGTLVKLRLSGFRLLPGAGMHRAVAWRAYGRQVQAVAVEAGGVAGGKPVTLVAAALRDAGGTLLPYPSAGGAVGTANQS
ncbi:hypothetical protein MMPV_008440 [Pyropia vietnamensis]